MSEPMRVVVLGLSHDHVWWNIAGLRKNPDIKIVGAWDPHSELTAKFAATVPGAEIGDDPHHLLHHHYPDAVLVCASNAESVHLVEDAASHGCHCVVEKPMANTLAGADAMLKAADEAGVKLIINWPICWEPSLWQAADLALSGKYGKLWQIRYRSAHNGPENVGCSPYFVDWLYDEKRNGPGAFTDYTCYGAAVCRWLLGRPEKVAGYAAKLIKTQDTPADNAVLLLSYAGAFGQIEASWTQASDTPRKGGAFHCEQALIEPLGNSICIATADNPGGEIIEAAAPPPHLASLGHYLAAIVSEEAEPVGPLDPRIARDAQAIMEAGWTAAQTGVAQPVA